VIENLSLFAADFSLQSRAIDDSIRTVINYRLETSKTSKILRSHIPLRLDSQMLSPLSIVTSAIDRSPSGIIDLGRLLSPPRSLSFHPFHHARLSSGRVLHIHSYARLTTRSHYLPRRTLLRCGIIHDGQFTTGVCCESRVASIRARQGRIKSGRK